MADTDVLKRVRLFEITDKVKSRLSEQIARARA
jgi:hypothetical protein